MMCDRCGREMTRRLRGPEGWICNACYHRDYHGRVMAAVRSSRLDAVTALVSDAVPELGRSAVSGAIARAASSSRAQLRLLDHLTAVPDALVSRSPHAPGVVVRLAAELVALGAQGVDVPACARCGRTVDLPHTSPEGRICLLCYRHGHVAVCGQCRRERMINRRTAGGLPLCKTCSNRDETRWEECVRCGRKRVVNARTDDGGAVCNSCYRQPPQPCADCGRIGIIASRRGGRMLCSRCYSHPRRPCGRCGRVRRVALRATEDHPDLCPACHWAAVAVCVKCGDEAPTRGVQWGEPICLRCIAMRRLDEVLTPDSGRMPESLLGLRDVFLAVEQPRSLFVWLDRSPSVNVLRDLANGRLPLAHATFDAMPQTASVRHLRQLLVACNALPDRNPHLARLERSVTRLVESLDDAEDRKLLESFARWRVLRHARLKADRGEFGAGAAKNARTLVAETARFLAWLRKRGVSPHACRQTDVDLWLATGVSTRRRIREFLVWAKARGVIRRVDIPESWRSGKAPRTVGDEARWVIARRLIHDDSLDPADRVVGTLVVLYGQPVTRVANLRRDDVVLEEDQTFVRVGDALLPVMPPLDRVLRDLPWRRQVGPSGKVPGASEWLFPGRQAGLHLEPEYLRSRLGALGIECRAARNAALLQLAGQLPAAVVADKLGVHPTTADRWVKLAGGDWARYAAQRTQAASGR